MRSSLDSVSAGPVVASTGVWVFDALTLDVIARWAPATMYDELGLTPDGRFVLASGLEGLSPDGTLADWAGSLTIHDARTGQVVEQVGDIVGPGGFGVEFLVPGPIQ
jgi:hypothetical protein